MGCLLFMLPRTVSRMDDQLLTPVLLNPQEAKMLVEIMDSVVKGYESQSDNPKPLVVQRLKETKAKFVDALDQITLQRSYLN